MPITTAIEPASPDKSRALDCLKQAKRAMIGRYGRSDDGRAAFQVLITLVPLATLWGVAIWSLTISYWLTAAAIALIVLFTVRAFALMHECGHGSLFRSSFLNRGVGFMLGVIAGMPQYVWSKHHSYHHTHNGNWERYRGPYTTLSVAEYAALKPSGRRFYRRKCSIACAPLVGFIYLIFNPRFTWMTGTVGLMLHLIREKMARPHVAMRIHAAAYQTPYWKTRREYWHMFWNNAVLLSAWGLLCWLYGSLGFFSIYVLSLSLAGAIGIVLFTVQHNFEHSYASDAERWDYDVGAMDGTSFLVLPGWLNWFTLNIGYHHIHHISSRIPNYRLVKCHEEYQHAFTEVRRVQLWQVPGELKCILWDTRARRIISVAEYLRNAASGPVQVG